ncbi:unnamed protein product [Echinostoma caproni]|uniref:DUF4280 domain-containing protein n=1 Tax=Echinostoma caproni TaxID=27848 RepID=A0A183BBX9_9TREM|nr:unnamed protein product [Echinostoma caproni]
MHLFIPKIFKPGKAKSPSGLTTYVILPANFVPHECVSVPELIKPPPCLVQTGPFDDRTNYRTDFVPKEVCLCCPAGFLPTNDISPDGYMFERIDERGHQLYKNVGTGKNTLPSVSVKQ